MSGILLGAGDMAVGKTESPALMEHILNFRVN